MEPLPHDLFAAFAADQGRGVVASLRRTFDCPDDGLAVDEPGRGRSDDVLAPPDWTSYIGQAKAKAEMQIRMLSAERRGAALPHTLILAGPGSGKTTLVRLVAKSAGLPMVALKKPPKNNDALLDVMFPVVGGGILFVDEAHTWGPTMQEALMQVTEDGELDTSGGVVNVERVTVICATTDPQKLLTPLRDRFGTMPEFVPYTIDEMGDIIDGMLERSGIELPPGVVGELAVATNGNPRLARHLAEAARDLVITEMPCDARSILAFVGVAHDGLTRNHLRYLERLSSACKHGTAGLQTIATLLQLPLGEVRTLERLLTDRGLVAYAGAAGRSLTPAGRRRLAEAA